MANYAYKKIGVEQIDLDLENPRTKNARGQIEAMALLLAVEGEGQKVAALALSICEMEGLDPGDRLFVVEQSPGSDRYTVLDGNRRLTALRLLSQSTLVDRPELMLSGAMQARFKRMQASFAGKWPSELEVVVFATRENAQPFIRLRHAGESDGAGRSAWSALQIARFDAAPVWLALKGLRDTQQLNLQAINQIDRSEFSITNFDRVIGTSEFQKRFAVTWQSMAGGYVGVEPRGVLAVAKVANDAASGRVSSRGIFERSETMGPYFDEVEAAIAAALVQPGDHDPQPEGGDDEGTTTGRDGGPDVGSDGRGDGGSGGGTGGASDGGAGGESDGGADGEPNGGADGEPNGGADGESDGGADGESDGGADGESDGGADGESDGGADGEPNGGAEGEPNGGAEGESDGGAEGESDGGAEGESDGGSAGGSDGGAGEGGEGDGKPPRKRRPSKWLIDKKSMTYVNDSKCRSIVTELKGKASVEAAPYACALLLRTLIEISVQVYIREVMKDKPTNRTADIEAVAKHLLKVKSSDDPQNKVGLATAFMGCKDEYSELSETAHSQWVGVSTDHVRVTWQRVGGGLDLIWKAIYTSTL